MKNKLLVCVFATALTALAFTSCKESTDFDAICNDVSATTLQGVFSGATPDLEALLLNVAQYRFNEDGTVERSVMALGDGVYNAPVTTKFSSWQFGEYGPENTSRYIILNPEAGGDPLVVSFTLGGILSEDQPFAGDKNDKIKDIETTQTTILGKKWLGNDTTYYKIDTLVDLMKYDTTYTYKPKKDPETGKTMRDSDGHIIYEQTIKSIDSTLVPTKMKWPVAPKTINIRRMELYTDASTHVNTGKWFMQLRAYDMDEERHTTVTLDTTSTYEFHWAFSGYSSASSYIVKARQADGTDEYFDIKFDAKIPAMTIDKQVLKIEE